MWKWTNPDDIKVIILDLDGLKKNFLTFPYASYIHNVQLYYVKYNVQTKPMVQGVTYYFDIASLLHHILMKSNSDSTSVISISDRLSFLKEMMQNHIGTILTNDFKKDYLKYTPDYKIATIEQLPMILENSNIGYSAEVYAIYGGSRFKKTLLRCEYDIIAQDGKIRKGNIFFGGRYYSERHGYILNDPLSYMVIGFKKQYNRCVDLFFDSAIHFISTSHKIDMITYIPLKPSDIKNGRYNRFKKLKLEQCAKQDLNVKEILICTKDFSQKGNDLFMRKEAVKGAFTLKKDINIQGKNVILMDDVYSSGSTLNEAIKILYENGAKEVIAVILAINQLTESYLHYTNLKCSVCGNNMVLKINNKTGKLFFGCKNFREHKTMPYTIDVNEGITTLKQLNKLTVPDIVDLEDEY